MSNQMSGNPKFNVKNSGSRSMHVGNILADPRSFLVVLLIFFLFSATVAFVNPLYESTDEIRHYRFIRILITEKRLPVQGAEPFRAQSHHPPLYHALSTLASAWVPSDHTGLFDHPRNPHWGVRNWEVGVDNKLQYWHPPGEVWDLDNLAVYISRLVNIALGACTISITYAIGVRLWSEKKYLALAPTVLVAFNPQFIYLSASINNDILAGLMGTAVLYQCLIMLQDGLYRSTSIRLGVLFGLAILSKIHLTALAPVIVLTLGLALAMNIHKGNKNQVLGMWLRNTFIIFGVAGLLSGWWFIRNLVIYGELTGMSRLNEMWGGRSLDNLWALQQGLPYMWTSLWGRFGYGQIPLPASFYIEMAVICSFGLLSFLLSKSDKKNKRILQIYLIAVVIFLIVVSYYILIQPAGAMGRFLFPVFPAFMVLVVAGWVSLVRSHQRMVLFLTGMMLGYALWALLGFWYPAIRYPSSVSSSTDLPTIKIGNLTGISDVNLSPQSIYPGEAVYLSINWHPVLQTEDPVTVYVHLVDEAGSVIAQRDTYPGLGRTATTSWRVDKPFTDVIRVDVPESTYNPNIARVLLGMYDAAGRFPVVDLTTGERLAEGVNAGMVEIMASQGEFPNSLDVNFDNQIRLVGYTIEPRHLNAGDSLTLALYWHPLRKPDSDYAVFAQVLDSNWQVWGSQDGGHPGWDSDQVIQETRIITLLSETPAGTYPIQVGLFDAQERLSIIDSEGRPLDNRVLLGPIRIERE